MTCRPRLAGRERRAVGPQVRLQLSRDLPKELQPLPPAVATAERRGEQRQVASAAALPVGQEQFEGQRPSAPRGTGAHHTVQGLQAQPYTPAPHGQENRPQAVHLRLAAAAQQHTEAHGVRRPAHKLQLHALPLLPPAAGAQAGVQAGHLA